MQSRFFARVDAAEHRLCLRINGGCRRPMARAAFRLASRLGDGIFWYCLMLLLPVVRGEDGLRVTFQMAIAAVIGVIVYRILKAYLVRERPYITHTGIEAHTAPLDRYSFPSGHTLHAVCFSLLGIVHYPRLAILLIPFTMAVAASRVALGLHYPTDVLAGATVGAALAISVLTLLPI